MPTPEQIAAFEAARDAQTGQLLLKAARLLDERALERLAQVPGAPPVRPAHTRLFPHLDFSGVRVTELAARLGISKQAVSALVGDLLAWDIVEQVPDPADGRARLVRFTPRGLEGLGVGLAVLGSFEREIEAEIGPEAMAGFRVGLQAAVRLLGG